MKELQRLRVGSFKIEDSITIDELKQEKNISSKIITIEGFFNDMFYHALLNTLKFLLLFLLIMAILLLLLGLMYKMSTLIKIYKYFMYGRVSCPPILITFLYMSATFTPILNNQAVNSNVSFDVPWYLNPPVSVIIPATRELPISYKGSLRSNEYVNVSDVGMMFNGGGHLHAAGCQIHATLEEAKQRVINEVKKQIGLHF